MKLDFTIIILTIINALLMSSGQILWKMGVSKESISVIGDYLKILFNPYIILGILIYIITTLLWLYILNHADLTRVYPVTSLVFVFVTVAGIFILHESVFLIQWVGIGLICAGVILTIR
ncbi:EamA family transporter [Desulfotruncus alcoholivorax]|uniref:EamA family transporter n=1 Tax=Desulfotruncus alcoholivorax TaxID=265477 RepID=UPI000400A4AF|nr:EamA family transporter [Desulfotruncus alcoholivorax]